MAPLREGLLLCLAVVVLLEGRLIFCCRLVRLKRSDISMLPDGGVVKADWCEEQKMGQGRGT
jgi:hypothetical protein